MPPRSGLAATLGLVRFAIAAEALGRATLRSASVPPARWGGVAGGAHFSVSLAPWHANGTQHVPYSVNFGAPHDENGHRPWLQGQAYFETGGGGHVQLFSALSD
eukprot:gene2184-biopygen5517